ncbi:MAG TPA: hypothetical protein DD401_05435 [Prevotella sp.]|nr:hypothetical protein [Prevotella sp.]
MNNKMNVKTLFVFLLAAFVMTACHDDKKPVAQRLPATSYDQPLKGDSTIYGLACEGCSDTAVVLLPSDGSDPVTYNIIGASRRHRVLGRIKTGDWIGVVLNKENRHIADIVIDLDQLKGIWCYIVMPQLRDHKTMTPQEQARVIREMPDSLKDLYFVPREYGFWLKRQWEATSVGYVQESSTLAEESPVVYPPLGWFIAWHIWNGKFVMTSGKPKYSGKDNTVVGYQSVSFDTCSIDYLDDDSLVLSDRDGSRSYYRKNDINDINKRAKAIAEMRSKQALKETTE